MLNPGGWPVAWRFLRAAVTPELDGPFLRLIADGALVTLAYATLGTALALLLGGVGGLFVSASFWRRASGRMSPVGRTGWSSWRAGLAVPRGLHEAVWGVLLVNVLGLDPLVAILAIAVPFGTITAKVWADLLDEAPRGPFRALRLAGVGRVTATLYGLVPQVRGDLLSYAFYRFECALRSAVLLGIVGAGGLGFQLDLSFSALRYGEMWTVLYAVVALCAAAEAVGVRLRRRLAAPSDGTPGRDPVLVAALIAAALLTTWSWTFLDVRPSSLVAEQAGAQAARILADAWPPQAGGTGLPTLLRLSVETVQMSVLAIALAAVGGALLAPVAARATRAGPGRRISGGGVRLALLVLRAVPPPVWALMLLFVALPGPLPGALALAAYNLGVLGRLMAEGVENLERAPTEALRLAGAPVAAAWLYGTLPRITPRFLVFGLYRWEVAVRETVVVGLVGAGGLGDLLAQQIAGFDWAGVAGTLLALVVLTFLVDVVSSAVRSAVR